MGYTVFDVEKGVRRLWIRKIMCLGYRPTCVDADRGGVMARAIYVLGIIFSWLLFVCGGCTAVSVEGNRYSSFSAGEIVVNSDFSYLGSGYVSLPVRDTRTKEVKSEFVRSDVFVRKDANDIVVEICVIETQQPNYRAKWASAGGKVVTFNGEEWRMTAFTTNQYYAPYMDSYSRLLKKYGARLDGTTMAVIKLTKKIDARTMLSLGFACPVVSMVSVEEYIPVLKAKIENNFNMVKE